MAVNILTYLEQSALAYPDKPAVIDNELCYTYSELMERAKQIGSALCLKTAPRKPIPVFLEKSANTLALFFGIVYSGCFYVLIDPGQPKARVQKILETLQPELMISRLSLKEQTDSLEFDGALIYIEDLQNTPINDTVLNVIRSQTLDIDPLYGIFTSGSTGIPKGVVVSHRSVIDFMEYFTDIFHITNDDVIGNQAPFDFDVSVKDIYSAIKAGATLVIIPKKLFSIPMQLLDYLEEHHVTTLIWAVSALCVVTTLKGFTYKIPDSICKVMFSGEVMPVKHLNQWQAAYPDAMFVNLYGPTEITCNCTYHIIDRTYAPGDILPIGKAFPNEKVFLLNETNQLISESNTVGELCVSGTALALGYYGNWEQTNKAFVQNPLNTHYQETIYRTGDLAFYNDEGLLCFASRKDFQIKHMGHRIELGEIEAALDKLPEIVRSCCIYREEKNRIICFYEGSLDKKELATQLHQILPSYMVPNQFFQVEHMPITKNGKIDRNQLKRQL